MAAIGTVKLPLYVRIGTGGEHKVGELTCEVTSRPKSTGDDGEARFEFVTPTPKEIRDQLREMLRGQFTITADMVVGVPVPDPVHGGQDYVVDFIVKQLGPHFPLTEWQRHTLHDAFRECPDCHHWIHTFPWLTGQSTRCPTPGCRCTG